MRVLRFFPLEGYGYIGDETQRLKFRVEAFRREPEEPLPLQGERVRLLSGGVLRVDSPVLLEGEVRSFDSRKGWGFVQAGEIYFLHRSEMLSPWIPLLGEKVRFWSGEREGKLRALYPVRAV